MGNLIDCPFSFVTIFHLAFRVCTGTLMKRRRASNPPLTFKIESFPPRSIRSNALSPFAYRPASFLAKSASIGSVISGYEIGLLARSSSIAFNAASAIREVTPFEKSSVATTTTPSLSLGSILSCVEKP